MAGRKASQIDLRFESEFLVLTHDLAQVFGTDAVFRRLAVLSVHQAGELFQLLQHVILEVPFITEFITFYETWGSSPAFSGAPRPPSQEASRSSSMDTAKSERLIICRCFPDPIS